MSDLDDVPVAAELPETAYDLASWTVDGIQGATLDQLRRIASRCGIALAFRSAEGAKVFLKVSTLRSRVLALAQRGGDRSNLPAFWFKGADGGLPSEAEGASESDAAEAPEASESSAESEQPSAPKGGSVEAAIRALVRASAPKGGAVDVAAVRRIVAEEVAKAKLQSAALTVTVRTGESEHTERIENAHPALADTLALLSCGLNVFLVGPRGSGKTTIARHAAQALKLPVHVMSFSGGTTESGLLGRLIPQPDGSLRYFPSPFVLAFTEGGVVLLDEIDAADPNVVLALNASLDGATLFAPQDPAEPEKKRHANFRCIAAANTWGTGATREYVGRSQLDGAFLDRFASGQVAVNYDAALEEKLVEPDVLRWGRSLRAAIDSNGLRRCISTRALVQLSTRRIALGHGSEALERSIFGGWSPDELAKVRKSGLHSFEPVARAGGAA